MGTLTLPSSGHIYLTRPNRTSLDSRVQFSPPQSKSMILRARFSHAWSSAAHPRPNRDPKPRRPARSDSPAGRMRSLRLRVDPVTD